MVESNVLILRFLPWSSAHAVSLASCFSFAASKFSWSFAAASSRSYTRRRRPSPPIPSAGKIHATKYSTRQKIMFIQQPSLARPAWASRLFECSTGKKNMLFFASSFCRLMLREQTKSARSLHHMREKRVMKFAPVASLLLAPL